jgi:type IX secretion system PorP/SprF family membrane protein
MKKIISYIVFALALMIGSDAFAQQIPVFNQYLYNPYIYNPARAGSEDLGRLFLGYKKQWADLPGTPSTTALTFDYPLVSQRSGVGVTMYSDQTHIINKVGGSLTYAYHIVSGPGDNQRISLGLSAGFLSQNIDFNRARVRDGADPIILTNAQNSTAFDASFGFHYSYENLAIDFAVPQLVNSSVRYLNVLGTTQQVADFSLINHYLGAVRYKIPVNLENQLYLEPVGMVRVVRGLPMQYDANFLLHWKEQFTVGAGWRSGSPEGAFASGLNVSLRFNLNDYFSATYIYEMTGQSQYRAIMGDTHEFSIGFKFGGTRKRVDKLENKMHDLEESGFQRIMDMEKAKQDSIQATREEERRQKLDSLGFTPEEWKMLRDYEMYNNLRLLEELRRLKRLKELNDILRLQEIMEIKERLEMIEKQKQEEAARNRTRGNNMEGFPTVQRITEDGDTLTFYKIGMVYFDKDSDDLRTGEKVRLAETKDKYKTLNNVVIVYLTGNASTEGGDAYNMMLSTRRCKAVREHLKSIGMGDAVFMILPYGEEDPLVQKDNTEAKREENRRVDILILKN